jgi:hypothetical protein
MHAGSGQPDEPGFIVPGVLFDEFHSPIDELLISRLHPLSSERTGVLANLFAHRAEARIYGLVILIRRYAVQYTAGPKPFPEFRIFGVIGVLRLFLGVQMIEVSVEFIEPMHRGQILVSIPQVVFPVLSGGVTLVFEQFGQCRIFLLETERGSGKSDFGQTGSHRMLPGDKGRAPRGTALLRVIVGKDHAFFGNAVDIGCLIAHQTAAVGADVGDAHIV